MLCKKHESSKSVKMNTEQREGSEKGGAIRNVVIFLCVIRSLFLLAASNEQSVLAIPIAVLQCKERIFSHFLP